MGIPRDIINEFRDRLDQVRDTLSTPPIELWMNAQVLPEDDSDTAEYRQQLGDYLRAASVRGIGAISLFAGGVYAADQNKLPFVLNIATPIVFSLFGGAMRNYLKAVDVNDELVESDAITWAVVEPGEQLPQDDQ